MGVKSVTAEIDETFGVSDGDAEITRDEIFDVLSNHRRIRVIKYLQESEEEMVDLRDVVDYVAQNEFGDVSGEVEYRERKSVYTALRQTHLPKLDELGIIEFEKSRGVMRLTNQANHVQMYLEYVPRHDIAWHVHYLGITALSAVLLGTTFFGIYPLDVGWSVLAALIFLMFGISALVHSYHIRGSRLEDADFVPIED